MAKRTTHRKTSPRAYRSAALAAIHENMADLHEAGAIDTKTMRRFDQACLTPVMTLTPEAIRRIRKKEAVSQAVFAAHLNVTTGRSNPAVQRRSCSRLQPGME